MDFLDKFGQMLRPHPDQYRMDPNLIDRFDPIDERELADSGKVMLSFLREHCIRGNARKFHIFLDGRMVEKISLDGQCSIVCEPGFHKLYVKLDSLTSSLMNVKTEAGKRYCFDIACTMNDGMLLRRVENRCKGEEE